MNAIACAACEVDALPSKHVERIKHVEAQMAALKLHLERDNYMPKGEAFRLPHGLSRFTDACFPRCVHALLLAHCSLNKDDLNLLLRRWNVPILQFLLRRH
jgi:hypothetical protein